MAETTLAERTDRVRFTLVQAGLDHISQGFTVFDTDLRLVGWNRTFFELLEFPFEMAKLGTPFADFMRYNALRGEYGDGDVETLVEVRVAAARAFQPHQMERPRPNGQIISVRGQPLPEGGFATIYTDVTEQRRYERLIREQNEILDARVHERTAALEAALAELKLASEQERRARAALAQAQKMEAVGSLTGGLAHDFSNLLTIIIGNLAMIDVGDRQNIAGKIAPALGAARRGADLIRRLLAFSRQQPLEPKVVHVPESLAGMMPLLRQSLPEAIEVEAPLEAMTDAWVRVDPSQFDCAILNLALNARDAMPNGGKLSITCECRKVSAAESSAIGCGAGDYVCVSLIDTGVGMDSETLARAFEPFFTRKEFGRASGLGLSMVYGFARQSGGAVRLRSVLGEGTRVTLYLPESCEVVDKEPETFAPEHAATGPRHLVLLVEDEPDVRKVVRLQLLSLGHVVLEASDGNEALGLLVQSAEISVLVSDIVMPGGLSGIDLAKAAHERRPDVRIVLMTGYAGGSSENDSERPIWPTLGKPFSPQDLARAISDHDDSGLNQSKIVHVIDSKNSEGDMQISSRNLRKLDCAGKTAQRPTFPHPAPGA
ncbi:MAG: PAS-domain containing protein [Beijerinckiaceae bacterium]